MLAGMYGRRRLTIQVNEVEAIVPHATRPSSDRRHSAHSTVSS